MRGEITPKNILMIGPTGVGKTEIARRLARLADAPFIKVEATKFTEVGYVGKDVDSIIRDLVDMAVKQARETAMKQQARARRRRRRGSHPRGASFPACAATSAWRPTPSADNTARQVMRKTPARRPARRSRDRDRGRRAEAVDGDHGPGRAWKR